MYSFHELANWTARPRLNTHIGNAHSLSGFGTRARARLRALDDAEEESDFCSCLNTASTLRVMSVSSLGFSSALLF